MSKIILEGDRAFHSIIQSSQQRPWPQLHSYTFLRADFLSRKDRVQEFCLLESKSGGHWQGDKGKSGNVEAKLLTLQFC